jgi:hypothetical protein
MSRSFSNADLEAYLDESLPIERMTAIEEALRHDGALQERLAAINGRRDAGVHAVGEIWRRHRLSCPSREQLGSFLLGVLADAEVDYVKFHIEVVECRYCAASIADLRIQHAEAEGDQPQKRRTRYFQSSAGYLRRST